MTASDRFAGHVRCLEISHARNSSAVGASSSVNPETRRRVLFEMTPRSWRSMAVLVRSVGVTNSVGSYQMTIRPTQASIVDWGRLHVEKYGRKNEAVSISTSVIMCGSV